MQHTKIYGAQPTHQDMSCATGKQQEPPGAGAEPEPAEHIIIFIPKINNQSK